MLRHGVYRLQFRLYTRETTVIYLKSGVNKNIPGLWDSCKVKWVIWHEYQMINMYHNVRSVATLFTESRVQHVTLRLSLSETERSQGMETTKFKEASLLQSCTLRSYPSLYIVMMRRAADIHEFNCYLLLKLLEFGSFSSDIWTFIALGKGWTKSFIHKWARNSLALHVMDIRDTQVHSALVNLSGDRGSTVVKVLCYKSEGRWFDPSWCHWNSLLT